MKLKYLKEAYFNVEDLDIDNYENVLSDEISDTTNQRNDVVNKQILSSIIKKYANKLLEEIRNNYKKLFDNFEDSIQIDCNPDEDTVIYYLCMAPSSHIEKSIYADDFNALEKIGENNKDFNILFIIENCTDIHISALYDNNKHVIFPYKHIKLSYTKNIFGKISFYDKIIKDKQDVINFINSIRKSTDISVTHYLNLFNCSIDAPVISASNQQNSGLILDSLSFEKCKINAPIFDDHTNIEKKYSINNLILTFKEYCTFGQSLMKNSITDIINLPDAYDSLDLYITDQELNVSFKEISNLPVYRLQLYNVTGIRCIPSIYRNAEDATIFILYDKSNQRKTDYEEIDFSSGNPIYVAQHIYIKVPYEYNVYFHQIPGTGIDDISIYDYGRRHEKNLKPKYFEKHPDDKEQDIELFPEYWDFVYDDFKKRYFNSKYNNFLKEAYFDADDNEDDIDDIENISLDKTHDAFNQSILKSLRKNGIPKISNSFKKEFEDYTDKYSSILNFSNVQFEYNNSEDKIFCKLQLQRDDYRLHSDEEKLSTLYKILPEFEKFCLEYEDYNLYFIIDISKENSFTINQDYKDCEHILFDVNNNHDFQLNIKLRSITSSFADSLFSKFINIKYADLIFSYCPFRQGFNFPKSIILQDLIFNRCIFESQVFNNSEINNNIQTTKYPCITFRDCEALNKNKLSNRINLAENLLDNDNLTVCFQNSKFIELDKLVDYDLSIVLSNMPKNIIPNIPALRNGCKLYISYYVDSYSEIKDPNNNYKTINFESDTTPPKEIAQSIYFKIYYKQSGTPFLDETSLGDYEKRNTDNLTSMFLQKNKNINHNQNIEELPEYWEFVYENFKEGEFILYKQKT